MFFYTNPLKEMQYASYPKLPNKKKEILQFLGLQCETSRNI